jgi:hypothetical protein
VNKHWVIDASSFIFLVKMSQTRLFTHLCDTLVIPDGVAQEIRTGAADDPARLWLQREGTPWVKDVQPVDPVIVAWDLGVGESEVLSWCYQHPGDEAIIDDGTALPSQRLLVCSSLLFVFFVWLVLSLSKGSWLPNEE